MKILALTSSYRKKGNTARVVAMIEAEMQALAARQGEVLNVETLYLGYMDVRACRGCRICFDRGEDQCPLKDDLRAIRAKIDEADGLILASPVYVDDVNSVAKAWIDRLAYVCHRPAFAGKCAYLVATVADSPTSHTLRTMNAALRTWGFHVAGQLGLRMGALMEQSAMERRYRGEAAKAAQNLFQAIAERRYLNPSFIALMIFKIQQMSWQKAADLESYDYAYWDDHGWFDPRCTYFIDHQANPIKVALARMVGTVVARFVA
jgi:multimeric flavodoxin WrbA